MEKSLLTERKRGKEWLDFYINKADKGNSGDFTKVKSDFEEYCNKLQNYFAYTNEIIEYTNDKLISALEFYFNLGIKHNFEHFKFPNKPSFFDEGYDEIMSDKELYKKDDYLEISKKLNDIIRMLPIGLSHNEYYEYVAFIDTVFPKMAHYYGFIYGNEIHKTMYEGFEPDYELTNKYRDWLNIYLQLDLE